LAGRLPRRFTVLAVLESITPRSLNLSRNFRYRGIQLPPKRVFAVFFRKL
jgi:hypothetical protein